jgi:hypothetical protein
MAARLVRLAYSRQQRGEAVGKAINGIAPFPGKLL